MEIFGHQIKKKGLLRSLKSTVKPITPTGRGGQIIAAPPGKMKPLRKSSQKQITRLPLTEITYA
jgi:hypothetical protein